MDFLENLEQRELAAWNTYLDAQSERPCVDTADEYRAWIVASDTLQRSRTALENPRKIAVFTTSDIQIAWDLSDSGDAIPVYTFKAGDPLYNGRVLEEDRSYYSTGALERAISLGYEIYVMSTRPNFGPEDDWWRVFVPAENVTYNYYRGGCAHDEGAISAWRELYRRLGHDPDKLILGHVTVHNEQEMNSYGHCRWDRPDWRRDKKSWTSYQYALAQIGVFEGRDFSDSWIKHHGSAHLAP